MLSIQQPKSQKSCTPNILPCRINHNGPVDASKRYWNPTTTEDGNPTAYFRGRKLLGKNVKIPEGYKGAVLVDSKKILPQKMEEEEEGDVEEEVRILEEHADFEEFLVWGHECMVEGMESEYVRGVEEWIGFAETMHEYSGESLEEDKKEE